MKKVLSILICVALILQLPTIARSETVSNAPSIKVLGSIGGPLNAVAPYGNIIYAAEGSSIIILERTEGGFAQKPFRLILPAPITDLKIEDKMLYAAAGGTGLHIIDISDPMKPSSKGVYQTTGTAETIAVKGSTIYLANGTNGLEVIDVSDPSKPVLVGRAFQSKSTLGLALVDNKVYIAAANDGVLVADVTQKSQPKELYTIKTPGIARNVVVSGSYAYVADDWKGIGILDISKTPTVIKSIEMEGRIYDVATYQNHLYCATDDGLKVLDLTDPLKPVEISQSVEGDRVKKVVALDGRAYCVCSEKGILCYDITDPKNVKLLATHSPLSGDGSIQVSIKDGYAYAACGGSGFSIIDVKEPENPIQIAHLNFGSAIASAKLNGEYAYLFSDDCIYTVAVSDPTKPFTLNETPFHTDGFRQNIAMDSGFLYRSSGNRLQVFSLKDPTKPVLMNDFMMGSPSEALEASDIAVRNGVAYIPAGYRGIRLYDVSDTGYIKSLGVYTNGAKKYGSIDFFNNRALVATPNDNSVEVLDITDITRPKYAGTIHTGALEGYEAAMTGNDALLPSDRGGIFVADISVPSATLQTAFVPYPGIPVTMDVQGDKAYVTDKSGTLRILELSIPARQPQGTPSASPSVSPSATPPAAPTETPVPKSPASGDKIAYLTFDDGPSKSITNRNLDTLKRYGIKATFFVLPHDGMDDIYKRILDEGHAIGNHSYSHDTGMFKNPVNFRTDVLKARDYIFKKFNYTTTVFRYPGGAMGRDKTKLEASVNVLSELGYTYFDWNASTNDTDTNLKSYGDEKYIVNLLTTNVTNHTSGKKKLVVLMHDSAGKTYTAKALPGIIEGLKKQGYAFDVLTNY